MSLTPLTELEAVNLILKNMGEESVSTITGTIALDASEALATLREVSKQVQSRGWWFNTEYQTLAIDGDSKYPLPANTLQVRSAGTDEATPVIARDGFLYNMTEFEHSLTWTSSTHKVRVVLGLSWDNLPQVARQYIALRASRVYQISQLGDSMNSQDDMKDEVDALATLAQEQMRQNPMSLKDSSSIAAVVASTPTLAVNA